MSTIQILIVEDEPIIADDLQFILEEMGYTKVFTSYNGEDAITFLNNNSVDLVLLDINLGKVIDGVQVAEYLQENHQIPYIFLTSLSDDTTIERVKNTNPSGYMVKPIDEKALKVNIELALNDYQTKEKNNHQYGDTYYVKDKIRMTKVHVSDIICLEGSSNYTIIYTTNKKFIVSQTMKKVMTSLDPEVFFRIHKSFIVNMNKIEYIEDSQVVIGDKKLAISRTYRDIFHSKLNTI